MIETDPSGNYCGTAQKQSLRTKTPIAAPAPTSTGIAIEVDAGEDEIPGDSEDDPPHNRSQLAAAGKTQKKSILSVHSTTIKHLTNFEKIILDEMVLNGRAVIVAVSPVSEARGNHGYVPY